MPRKQNRQQRRKPKNEQTMRPRDVPPDLPEPPPSLEPFKTLGVGTQTAGRTRGEIRLSCQHVFDARIRPRLEAAVDEKDDQGHYTTPLKEVLGIAELYARIGIGFIGANDQDPADIAKLPPPVFALADENAPLPDGKPDPIPSVP
jgi:hypothetical protein